MDNKRSDKNRRTRNLVIASGLVIALSGGGAAAWAADRFLIEHVEIADVSAYEDDNSSVAPSAGTTDAADATVTATSYSDGATSVTISTVTEGSGSDTVTYYVADVTLSDATTLRSAFAKDQFGENITQLTSGIAADNSAIFAVNGDYYGFRDTGIVIRNGVVYRDEPARQGLVFYTDGRVEVYDETTTTADELLAAGAWNTLSFGPAIVEDGTVVEGIEDTEVDTNFGNHSIQGDQPRTAVGVIDENHLVFVVVDGRQSGYSAGVTLTELADIMVDLGATTAYNLDGGGSSTMYFNGDVVNQPSNGGERATSDILYIGDASADAG
ncbi:phosphodiester glycosidase family protein [Microbacterium sp. M3]|uniref:Phosphodiester glycosidase family protein n=1 Tax=Microbacterium arthrosphaerae TaxID=792652 RepID=A0ABU4GY64_9MICO|nr:MULTISPECIES: phosphodiester glycosidase family protein [Microbacterium]MDW4571394.1 phosphodiester glycosidase family protein [Microbacterium arthrosphaerae]MDW7605249.1 phosphodiester glycosidase family protein [Microbacterium sp. M3]